MQSRFASAPSVGVGAPHLPGFAPAVLLVLALFAVSALLHFPGDMNNDSIVQYRQAVSGQYHDWHPPVMAWLWSQLRVFGDGPAPLLMLHLMLFWLGFGLLADGVRRTGQARLALLVALGGAFPPFVWMNAQVTKDVGMVASWIAAVGALYWFHVQERRVPELVALLIVALFAYGALVRTNAVFALGPLVLYALAPAHWLANVRLFAAAVLVAMAAVPISQVINRLAFAPVQQQPVQSLFLFDLMGIAAHTGDPRLLEPRVTMAASELQACYTPYWWDSLSPWGRCTSRVNRPASEVTVTLPEGLALQWLRTIGEHPVAYVTHRLKHFNSSLLFAVPLKHIRFTPDYRTDGPGGRAAPPLTESDIKGDLLRKNPLVWPATWVSWTCFLLWILACERPTPAVRLARVLAVSALGYSGAYLLIGVATDMRYHYWTMLAALVGTLLVLPQLWQRLRSRFPPLLIGLGSVALVVGLGLAARLLDFKGLV